MSITFRWVLDMDDNVASKIILWLDHVIVGKEMPSLTIQDRDTDRFHQLVAEITQNNLRWELNYGFNSGTDGGLYLTAVDASEGTERVGMACLALITIMAELKQPVIAGYASFGPAWGDCAGSVFCVYRGVISEDDPKTRAEELYARLS
mgnify:CR=1 FL=1